MRHSRHSKPSAMPTSCLLSLSEISPETTSPDRAHCVPNRSSASRRGTARYAPMWRLVEGKKKKKKTRAHQLGGFPDATDCFGRCRGCDCRPSPFPDEEKPPQHWITSSWQHVPGVSYLRARLACSTYVHCLNSVPTHIYYALFGIRRKWRGG